MPALIGPEPPHHVWTPPVTPPFEEAVWDTWIAKGLKRDRRKNASRGRIGKWIVAMVMIAAAALWPDIAPFEITARSVLTVGALMAMFLTLHEKRYPFAAAFGGLALLFNPIAPIVAFSSAWLRALVAATALLVALSSLRQRIVQQDAQRLAKKASVQP